MREKEIASRENPAVKRYVALAGSRRERRRLGLFVTEGAKLTLEAFGAGYRPVELFVTEAAWEDGSDALADCALAAERFCRVSDAVAQKLAQSVTPQGVFAVFSALDNGAQPVKIGNNGKFLLLSSLQDPGNLGTILRTAAAFGIDGVFLSADCPDLFSPKVLRASMGGVFKAPVRVAEDLGAEIDALRAAGVTVYAAALGEGAASLRETALGPGCAVVIGNEGNGLAPELAARCDRALVIPMEPGTESLNAAMAAGILLWEIYRNS